MKKDKKLVEIEEEVEIEQEIPYSVLNEKELKLKKEQEKSKAKKKGKRGIALFLSLLMLGSVGYGAKKVYDGSDLKYNNEIKSAYTQTLKNLSYRLSNSAVINGFRFFDPTTKDGPALVEVYATHTIESYSHDMQYNFEIANNYYKALKQAEEDGDIKAYVSALNDCFENMKKVDEIFSNSPKNTTLNEEEAIKFNEMFSLNSLGLNQVGFLPQFIGLTSNVKKEDGTRDIAYTFKGLSFVRVNKGEGYDILPSNMNNAVLTEKLDAKKIDDDIKVYEVTYTWSQTVAPNTKYGSDNYIYALKQLFNNGDYADHYTNNVVTPTFVREIDLTDYKLQTRNFDFNQTK